LRRRRAEFVFATCVAVTFAMISAFAMHHAFSVHQQVAAATAQQPIDSLSIEPFGLSIEKTVPALVLSVGLAAAAVVQAIRFYNGHIIGDRFTYRVARDR
jgi:hypothetical protein